MYQKLRHITRYDRSERSNPKPSRASRREGIQGIAKSTRSGKTHRTGHSLKCKHTFPVPGYSRLFPETTLEYELPYPNTLTMELVLSRGDKKTSKS